MTPATRRTLPTAHDNLKPKAHKLQKIVIHAPRSAEKNDKKIWFDERFP